MLTLGSIQDGDGEFLLIESALHLPDWLKPETADNRVPLSAYIVLTSRYGSTTAN